MKQVDFYLIENRINHAGLKLASRLAKKLQGLEQSTIMVVENAETLARLDETLWTFSDTSFVAHDRISGSARARCKTHLALTTELENQLMEQHYDVLVNLSAAVPGCCHHFARIADIVEVDEDARVAGRNRFRQYRDEGFEIKTHSLEL